MSRRYFEHLYAEVCVALDRRVSRYAFWLLIWEAGGDPDDLTRENVRTFLEQQLPVLLREEGAALSERGCRNLKRSVLAFNPEHPTPEEWLVQAIERQAS